LIEVVVFAKATAVGASFTSVTLTMNSSEVASGLPPIVASSAVTRTE
jgi:hypothetical protein